MTTFVVTQKRTENPITETIKARGYKDAGSKFARKHNLTIGYLNIRKVDNLEGYEIANGYADLDYDIYNHYTY